MNRFHRTDFDLLPERAVTPRLGRFGGMTLEGKGGSAPAPDPRLTEAQLRSMNIQDEAIKGMVAQQGELVPLQKQLMQQAIDAANTAQAESASDRQWILSRRGALTGLQDKMVADASSFDTEARRSELAGQAITDVNAGFASARGQSARALASYGITPGSGRAMAVDGQLQTAEALASAGASTQARGQARQEGYSLTDRAQNALAGYPSMGMQATGATAGYGSAGLSLANQGSQGILAGYQGVGQMAGAMGQNATGMFGQQANYSLQAAGQAAGNAQAKMSAIGTVAGAAIAAF